MKTTGIRIKTSQWMLWAIYLLAAMNLEIFKVFGDSLFLGNVNRYMALTVLFSAFVLLATTVQSRTKTSGYILLIAVPLILRMLFAVFNANIPGYGIYNLMQYCMGYFCILFAFPIYYVLKRKKTSVRDFIKVLFALTIISILIKSFVSIFNYFTGTIVFPATVYHKNWYRYGLLRMQPPALSNIAVPMGAFLMYTETKRFRSRTYAFLTLLVIAFSALIHASRFTAIWQGAVLVYIIMMKRKSNTKQIVIFSIFVGLAILLSETGIIDSVQDTFSVKNKELGGNTTVRLIALYYFGKQILTHPILGIGIVGYGYTESLHIVEQGYAMGDITDVGIIYSIVQFGVIIIAVMAILLIRLFVIGKNARRMGHEPYCILLWGSALCILLGNISIDFFVLYPISVPVIIAVAEYCNYELTKEKNLSRVESTAYYAGGKTN